MKTVIVENRNTDYVIAVPVDASPVEQTAARELQVYLQKALQVQLLISPETEIIGKAFYVGHTAYADAAGIRGETAENWKIRVHHGNVVLTGGLKHHHRGVIYSVYHFLEDVVGVRWWSIDEEDVPQLTELALNEDFAAEGTPKFHYRKLFVNSCRLPDFSYASKMRTNVVERNIELEGGSFNANVRAFGGAMEMGAPNHCHSVGYYLPAETYFPEHPDWYAWSEVEGKRISYGHPCLNNDEMFQTLLDKLLHNIGQQCATAEAAGVESPCFWSVSLNDTEVGICQCEKCKAQIEKSGLSGYLLQFINRLAREVAKVYPNAKLETLIYESYIEPPADDTAPDKNVIIRLANVDSDIHHDIHARGNKKYLRLLQAWHSICKRTGAEIYIWEYMYNLFMPFPFVLADRLSDTFKTFWEYGVTGVMVENETTAQDMWEMNQYLLYHLCEDPQADAEALMEDFIQRFYRQAAPHVKDYINLLRTASKKYDIALCCVRDDARYNFIDSTVVVEGKICLAKALEAVKGDQKMERRIQWMEQNLNKVILLKYFDLKHQAEQLGQTFDLDREQLRQQIFQAMDAFMQWHPNDLYVKSHIEDERAFFGAMVFTDEEIAPLPAELSHVDPKDTYQFYFKDTIRAFLPSWNRGTGVTAEQDPEASVSAVMKLNYDQASKGYGTRMYVTSQDAPGPKMLDIYVRQDEAVTIPPKFYREDLQQEGYHLYHIGTAKNIPDTADTRLFVLSYNHTWVNLSGIAVTFPMEECDIYLSMKFTGSLYGGDPKDENAIYLERMILVRK